MRKTVFLSVCVLLLCGGLFCLHLTAQPERTSNPSPVVSLLEMNFDEVSERQLLEMKVDAYKKLLDLAILRFESASPSGTAIHLAEARAKLAAAQIELYRHTGEQDKLLAALQARIDILKEQLQHEIELFRHGARRNLSAMYETEIKLLDALLEQKRARAE